MADGSFTGISTNTGGEEKKHPSLQPQCHIIAKTTDAIDLGESTVSYPVSSSSSTLHEALEAFWFLSRGHAAALQSSVHDD